MGFNVEQQNSQLHSAPLQYSDQSTVRQGPFYTVAGVVAPQIQKPAVKIYSRFKMLQIWQIPNVGLSEFCTFSISENG